MKAATIEIEIEATCTCGDDLEVESDTRQKRLIVEPCESCMEKAAEEAVRKALEEAERTEA